MVSQKYSEREINELYDIFKLANEENDKQQVKETLDKFVNEYQGRDPKEDSRYYHIQKRYMKRHNKLKEDAHEVELRHIYGLVNELVKEFIITKEEVNEIMEEFGDTTESLYLHIASNYDFRKLTKQKTIQLLKAKA